MAATNPQTARTGSADPCQTWNIAWPATFCPDEEADQIVARPSDLHDVTVRRGRAEPAAGTATGDTSADGPAQRATATAGADRASRPLTSGYRGPGTFTHPRHCARDTATRRTRREDRAEIEASSMPAPRDGHQNALEAGQALAALDLSTTPLARLENPPRRGWWPGRG
jgi:hypothetical protein